MFHRTVLSTFYLARIPSNRYNFVMERVFNKFSSYEEAEDHDIQYYLSLSVEERQSISLELKKRAYGDHVPDIRAYHKRR